MHTYNFPPSWICGRRKNVATWLNLHSLIFTKKASRFPNFIKQTRKWFHIVPPEKYTNIFVNHPRISVTEIFIFTDVQFKTSRQNNRIVTHGEQNIEYFTIIRLMVRQTTVFGVQKQALLIANCAYCRVQIVSVFPSS